LGSSTTPHYDKEKRKDRRVLVQDKVRASLEEQQARRMEGWNAAAWSPDKMGATAKSHGPSFGNPRPIEFNS